MFRFRHAPAALFLTCLCFSIAGTNAQQTEIKIVTGEIPPYAYMKDGRISGVATDVVQELMVRVGFAGDIYVLPWKRALMEAEQSKLIYPFAKTPDRESRYKWIGPIMKDQLVFVVRASDTRTFRSIDDFRNLKTGVNRGAPTDLRLEKLGFRMIDHASTEGQNLEKLLAGRFDAWFTSTQVLKGTLQQRGGGANEVKVAFSDQNFELYIGVSPNVEDKTVNLWQKHLDQMKSEGSYRMIMKRHGIDAK